MYSPDDMERSGGVPGSSGWPAVPLSKTNELPDEVPDEQNTFISSESNMRGIRSRGSRRLKHYHRRTLIENHQVGILNK